MRQRRSGWQLEENAGYGDDGLIREGFINDYVQENVYVLK